MFVIARVHGLTPLLPHFFSADRSSRPNFLRLAMALGRYMIGLYHYSSHSLLMSQSPFPCLFLEVCSTGTAWTLRSHQFSLSTHSAIDMIHLNELRATRKHDAVGLCPAASALFRWDAFGHARYYPPRLEWPLSPKITLWGTFCRARYFPPCQGKALFTANYPTGG